MARKKTWDELSESERKEYVNQDCVSQRELLVENIENHTFVSPWGSNKSNFSIIYEMYFLDNKSVLDITHHIDFTEQGIHKIVKKMKESIEDFCSTQVQKDILYKHFHDGTDQQKLSEEVGIDPAYTSRIINSYLSYCKRDKREKECKD